MKKLLLALLCFGLVACTPKQPEPVPEDKTLKIIKNENIDSINNTMEELYLDVIDFVRVQDGKLLFILNDKSHNHTFTTKQLYAYDLQTYESKVIVPLTNSRRVTDFCLSNQFGVFNMNFDDYYRLEYDAIHTYVGHVPNYTKMPPFLVSNGVYTYLSENDHQTFVKVNEDGSYTNIGEMNGYLEPTLCKANDSMIYYVGGSMIYSYDHENIKTFDLQETITNTILLQDSLLINGKYIYDPKTMNITELATSIDNIQTGCELEKDIIVYQDTNYKSYVIEIDGNQIESHQINLPNDELELLPDNNGKVYACLTNTHLETCEVYEIYFE